MAYQTAEGTRLQQSVSLLRRHLIALRWLTKDSGEENMSATVRKLLEQAMRQRFGPNWLEHIEQELAETDAELLVVA
jgi:hypothetical protein